MPACSRKLPCSWIREHACFREQLLEPVWTYTLGGYQVLKKWLSYRESALLGRPITGEEAQEFTHHVRRIAAIVAMQDALDSHYSASILGISRTMDFHAFARGQTRHFNSSVLRFTHASNT